MPLADRTRPALAVCVDFGSTFTKALLVDLTGGSSAGAEHRTTIDTDVLDGYDACLADLVARRPAGGGRRVLACSSAGGGLRIAVVGNEELVTAEAGRRVALSSGGKVVAVRAVAQGARPRPHRGRARRRAAHRRHRRRQQRADPARGPGLVDGGWRGPVVVAGNVDARDEVARSSATSRTCWPTTSCRGSGCSPRTARGARSARCSWPTSSAASTSASARDFTAMVRGATPDVVLTGVELLATRSGEVVVVDVGGATTDVHSVVELDPEEAELARDVVAPTPVTRTVEGDLGMRWSAISTVEEAGCPSSRRRPRRRRDDPGFLPDDRPGAGRRRGDRPRRGRRSRCAGTPVGPGRGQPEGRVVERTG